MSFRHFFFSLSNYFAAPFPPIGLGGKRTGAFADTLEELRLLLGVIGAAVDLTTLEEKRRNESHRHGASPVRAFFVLVQGGFLRRHEAGDYPG